MRRLTLAVAVLLACSPTLAAGPIIKWDRFEGVHFQADDNGCVGGAASGVYICPGRPRSSGPGQAILNLDTGLLTFRVTGISNAAHYPNGVLGGPAATGGTFGLYVALAAGRTSMLSPFCDAIPLAARS